MAYEISAGYYSKEHMITIIRIAYGIKTLLEPVEWQGLEIAEIISDEILPQMGLRAFRTIYVMERDEISRWRSI